RGGGEGDRLQLRFWVEPRRVAGRVLLVELNVTVWFSMHQLWKLMIIVLSSPVVQLLGLIVKVQMRFFAFLLLPNPSLKRPEICHFPERQRPGRFHFFAELLLRQLLGIPLLEEIPS